MNYTKPALILNGVFFTIKFVALLNFTGTARADIYRYKDKHGVIHFTNTPVDERYKFYKKEPGKESAKPVKASLNENRYDNEIFFYGSRFTVEPAFIKAVMKVESDFNPVATSVDGALGLMQLMPETAEHLGVKNPFNPQDNIHGGVKHLSGLLKKFGNRRLAAAAYNAGENAVVKYSGIPPFKETKNYVNKVIRYYNAYQKAGYGRDYWKKGENQGTAGSNNTIYTVQRKGGVTVYTNMPWVYADTSTNRK